MNATVRTLLASLALAIAGCATTTLSDVWLADGAAARHLQRFVVIGIGPDPIKRAQFEDALAARMRNATAGHAIIPAEEIGDRDRIQARLRAGGYDGAVVVRLLGVEQSEVPVPKHASELELQTARQWDSWDPGYFGRQGEIVTTRTVRLEVRVFAVADGAKLFSAHSRSYDPTGPRDVADQLFAAVTAELHKRGID